MRRAHFGFLTLLLAWGAAVGQEPPKGKGPGEKPMPEQRPVNEFLPYSFLQFVPFKHFENIEPGTDKDYSANVAFPYYLEGTIAPNLILFENHTRVLLDSGERERTRVGWDLSITPQIEIRLYRTPSLPVRHPSFKPQLTSNVTFYFPEHAGKRLVGAHKLNLQAKLQHYSNGAEGCLFQEDTAAVEFEHGEWRKVCRENTGEIINNLDGEFTTSFIALGMFYHYSWLDYDGGERQAFRSHVQVDLQPAWLRLPGSSLGAQRHVYNPDLKVTATSALYSRTYKAVGGFKYFGKVGVEYYPMIAYSNNIDRAPYVTPYGLDLQLGWLPDNKKFLRGWSFYTGVYTGQDPYNIEFRHKVTQVNFGFISTSALQFRMR
jgi:hypothetical protein